MFFLVSIYSQLTEEHFAIVTKLESTTEKTKPLRISTSLTDFLSNVLIYFNNHTNYNFVSVVK